MENTCIVNQHVKMRMFVLNTFNNCGPSVAISDIVFDERRADLGCGLDTFVN